MCSFTTATTLQLFSSRGALLDGFAQPVSVPVWIHNPAIDEALIGLQSE